MILGVPDALALEKDNVKLDEAIIGKAVRNVRRAAPRS